MFSNRSIYGKDEEESVTSQQGPPTLVRKRPGLSVDPSEAGGHLAGTTRTITVNMPVLYS